MFIAKDGNLIVLARDTREELEADLQTDFYRIIYDTIEETAENYVCINNDYLTEAEAAEKERERLSMLNLTSADVERAIYKVKGLDFEDILDMVKDNPAIDSKALRIEFKANNFYRGNPYIDQVGTLLGLTGAQLDAFFESGDYTKLLAESEE